jgi:hypothetical protein
MKRKYQNKIFEESNQHLTLDPSGTLGPQMQARTMTNDPDLRCYTRNDDNDPDLRRYARNDDNIPPPKIAPPVFLSVAPQVF